MRLGFKVIGIALISALLVLLALALHLNKGLPETQHSIVEIPAAGLKFAFGSGKPEKNIVQVDEFADGYALLSSGPVNIQADQLQTLQYSWKPHKKTAELAFFWRQKGNLAEVKRAEILTLGTAFLDLSTQPDWHGEIVELGLLVGGDNENPVTIGELVLRPINFNMRARLAWQDWTTYELRSQQSINFLQGGAHNQTAPLPLLIIAWLIISMVLLYVFANKLGIKKTTADIFPIAAALFLTGWMLLDIRWSVNSFRNASELLRTAVGSNDEQRAGNDLDGEIFKYVQRLKNDIIQPDNTTDTKRILIIGDEHAVDYYLLRSKYHLLPSTAHVAGQLGNNLKPESLDYIIYFGQAGAITNIPGWSGAWRDALKEVDRSEWGAVYQVKP